MKIFSKAQIASGKALVATLWLAACLLLSACAGGVRGEAPFAQVMNWRIDGRDLVLDLRLRNVNDHPLEVRSIELDITVSEATRLVRHAETRPLEIAAGGFETLRFELEASADGTAQLVRLSEGEINNLPYRLEGTVITSDNGELPIERSGRIYTVPGRPGEFR